MSADSELATRRQAARIQKTHAPSPSSGPNLSDLEAQARTELGRILSTISARHGAHSVRLKQFSLGHSSGEIKISFDGPDVWAKVSGSKLDMCSRIRETIEHKYGGHVRVFAEKGSITLTIIFSAIEVARNIFELLTSIGTISEYIIRCIEQSKFDWPPVSAMFSFFESIKRVFLGI